MATAAWLTVAYHSFPATSFDVNGNGDQTVSAGDYYPYDATATLSFAHVLAAAIQADAGVATCTASWLESGKLKLTMDGVTAVTWGSGTLVRDVFGFTGNLAGASSYIADKVSPLFWSPGKTESPELDVLGGTGAEDSDIVYGMSPTVVGIATEHNTRKINAFTWRNVASSRFRSSSEANGEFFVWWQRAKKLANLKLYRSIVEDTSGTDAASLSTVLGPYILDPRKIRGNTFPFARSSGFSLVDQFHPVSIDVVTTAELDNS
jgi:hypothetical protein